MRKRGWKTIQLPEELLNRVDDIVRRPELGYTSRSEFIKEAVRLRVEQVENRIHGRVEEKERKAVGDLHYEPASLHSEHTLKQALNEALYCLFY